MLEKAKFHSTIKKFGYPDSLIKSYAHWNVLLRPKQPTLGSLVLVCKEDHMAFSEISRDAFDEMRGCVRDIEFTLKKLFEYDKINYLMLMMVDPHVHYHVIPRYEQAPVFKDMTCQDTGWPGQPDLGHDLNLSEEHMDALQDLLIKSWP